MTLGTAIDFVTVLGYRSHVPLGQKILLRTPEVEHQRRGSGNEAEPPMMAAARRRRETGTVRVLATGGLVDEEGCVRGQAWQRRDGGNEMPRWGSDYWPKCKK